MRKKKVKGETENKKYVGGKEKDMHLNRNKRRDERVHRCNLAS